MMREITVSINDFNLISRKYPKPWISKSKSLDRLKSTFTMTTFPLKYDIKRE